METHTITGLLADICAGDEEALEKVVDLFLDRLVGVARQTYRQRFGDIPRPVEDEEDAALSALNSFCARARDGKIPKLTNRRHLWKLLVKITIGKVYDQRDRATAKKRGGMAKKRRGKDPLGAAEALSQVVSKLTGPDVHAALEDTIRAAMRELVDPELKRIAEMELNGSSCAEIAEALGFTERTVYRKLELIHEHWDRHFADNR